MRKLSILFQYIKLLGQALISGERVTRYQACFIFHEPRNTLIQRIRRRGRYEPFVEDFCRRVLPDDGLFVDVGANIGLIALPLLRAKPEANALLFEPSPIAYRLLLKSLSANRLEKRATVFDYALSDESRDAVSFIVNDYPDRSMDGLSYTERTEGSRTILVSQRTLDDVIESLEISRIDLIKLDCEGAELLVLRGAKRCIDRFRPIIVMEFNRSNYIKYGVHARDLWDWAQKADYLIAAPTMDVLDLCILEIRIGAAGDDQFILFPKNHKWRGI